MGGRGNERLRNALANSLLLAASITLTYLVMEVAYRFYRYENLRRDFIALVQKNSAHQTDQQIFAFDHYVGYIPRPNYERHRGPPFNNTSRTNSHGHVSNHEYPREKPPGEYRVALIGDSFVASTLTNVRWPDLLEAHLNAAPEWRASVGGKFTRVINFGVDGYGMVQFAGMVCHHVPKFDPNLVVVNFIADDLLRTLRYLQRDGADIDGFVRVNYLNKIDWYSPRPELLAATIPRIGIRRYIPADVGALVQLGFRYDDRQEAIRASKKAIRDIGQCSPKVVFIHHPTIEELDHNVPMPYRGLLEDLSAAAPEWSYVSMLPRMEALLVGKRLSDRPDLKGLSILEITALPQERWPELYRWFLLPTDHHYSDYGSTLYARELGQMLIERSRNE